MSKRKAILIDSNNLAYRAFYALPATIAASTGIITNAVYGFTSMLLKLLEDQAPDMMICAFDSRGPTFRHEIFKDYKLTRKKMPEELIAQMPLIKEVLYAFGIPFVEIEKYEADDIIATLVKKIEKDFDEVIIVSGDKDILQLISEKVKVMANKKGITDTVLFDRDNVSEKFGIPETMIRDYLALTGDTSDNIPGVPGIGPKTARELLTSYGSIDKIYENIDKIKSEKLRDLLIRNKNIVEKSRILTRLDDNLEIKSDLLSSELRNEIDIGKIEHVFETLEFSTFKKRLKNLETKYSGLKNTANTINMPENSNGSKEGKRTVKKKLYINTVSSPKLVGRDNDKLFLSVIETGSDKKSLEKSGKTLLLIMDQEEVFFIYDTLFLSDGKTSAGITGLLQDKNIIKSGFDFKYIYKALRNDGIFISGSLIDYKLLYLISDPVKSDISTPALLEYVRNRIDTGVVATDVELEIEGSFGKDTGQIETEKLLKDQMRFDFEEKRNSLRSARSGKVISGQPEPEISRSANETPSSMDSDALLEVIRPHILEMLQYAQADIFLMKQLLDEKMEKLYLEVEEPLISVLAEMEHNGVNIDRGYLSELIGQYDKSIEGLTHQIYKLCGSEFNINSTQQLAIILYEKLNLPITKKTKTGFSTDAGSLYTIRDKHPVIEKILEYREKVKLKNTYIDVLPNLISERDKRVHTTYNQLGTTTGRISSNNPNLQNIPVRSELGRQIRRAFIPGTSYDLLLSADYSQIELRVLAHLSEDPDLIETFNSGQDIHTRTASEIFNVSYDSVDDNLRRRAKAINFGILYGMTEFGLKNRLAISEEEAREYIKLYFARYPGIKIYLNRLIKQAYGTGYATTMFGRKRYIKELSSPNANIRSFGERLAVNTPIQGSAADIMKIATVRLYDNIKTAGIDSNIILHVHDEIVLEIKKDDSEPLKIIVIDSMENCVDIKAGLKVDIKLSKDWFF